MAVFEYHGITVGTGKTVRGVRDAESVKALRVQLRKDGVLLTTAAEEKAAKEKRKGDLTLKRLFDRVSIGDLAIMTRQLATLVRAKILFEALQRPHRSGRKGRAPAGADQHPRSGARGYQFRRLCPRASPQDLPAHVREHGARRRGLGDPRGGVADRVHGQQAKLRGKVTSALAYPILMMIIAVILISVLMVAVVPKVTGIFQNMGRALPWYTSLLIAVSSLPWPTSGGSWRRSSAAASAFRRWKRGEGRLIWDTFVLGTPIFGPLVKMIAIARFSRTLATLLNAGVALLGAMGIVKEVLVMPLSRRSSKKPPAPFAKGRA